MKNVSTSTRGRKFNINKFVINRAWEIAKNAAVAHNTNPVDVALTGLVRASDFFAESMRLAWVEGKRKAAKMADFEVHTLHKVPKKNQAKILGDIAATLIAKGLVKAKVGEDALSTIYRATKASFEHREALATAIFHSRFGTPVSKSQNRHILKAIPELVETHQSSDDVLIESAFDSATA